ncbi:MAG: hypothetical protein WBW32_03610 [Luteibacter sp.]
MSQMKPAQADKRDVLSPSKLAAMLVALASAAFGTLPVWVMHIALPEDGLRPHIVSAAFALAFLTVATRSVESFSARLCKSGASQIKISIRRLAVARQRIEWNEVSSAVSDGRYLWLNSQGVRIQIDSGVFWHTGNVFDHAERHLRPFGVIIAFIDKT